MPQIEHLPKLPQIRNSPNKGISRIKVNIPKKFHLSIAQMEYLSELIFLRRKNSKEKTFSSKMVIEDSILENFRKNLEVLRKDPNSFKNIGMDI